MQTLKKRLPILFLFLALYFVAYYLVGVYQVLREKEILSEQEKYLEMSYKQGLDRFETVAGNVFTELKSNTKLLALVADTNAQNIEEKQDAVYNSLYDEFERLKLYGVLGIQIVTPENLSIVRMHEREKFWDDLSDVRPMIRKVNELKTYQSGFEEGKVSHAFRYAFPLHFDGVYIGAMEILFSSTKLQDYTMRVSNIHTHFIVNKNVFKTNEWESKSQDPYAKSIEHDEYLFSISYHMNQEVLLKTAENIIFDFKEQIAQKMAKGENFSISKVLEKNAKAVVFLGVQRYIDNQTVAYLVSYTDVKKLYDLNHLMNIIKIFLFVLTLLLYFITTRLLLEKETVLHELKYDDLTKIHTRKYFMDFAKNESQRLKENDEVFCIVMADIDHFKKVNDTYGHQYGDTVLQEFATILKESIRSVDIVARYGGEEFVIFLHTDIKNAYVIVENIRQKIQNFSFGEKKIKVTSSFGITQSKNANRTELKTLIANADSALYSAKKNGRNQVKTA